MISYFSYFARFFCQKAISIGIPINTASLPSCARQTQQISATVSTTMCSKFISNSRIFAIVMIGVLLLFCSASIYISWGQRLHLTSRGRIEDWARDVCGENRNANQYLMPFSFRLKAQDSTLTGLKPWEGQRPWEGTGWTMLLGKGLCTDRQMMTNLLLVFESSGQISFFLFCFHIQLVSLPLPFHLQTIPSICVRGRGSTHGSGNVHYIYSCNTNLIVIVHFLYLSVPQNHRSICVAGRWIVLFVSGVDGFEGDTAFAQHDPQQVDHCLGHHVVVGFLGLLHGVGELLYRFCTFFPL